MKKKLISIFLVMTLVLSLAGCGKKSSESATTSSGSANSYIDQLSADQENYAQYVTLGNYKGIEVTVDRSTLTVADSAVQDYINGVLSDKGTTTAQKTGTTKSGDAIVLDYSGLLNGVAFTGGTATDATYTVGSGQFITDLDKGLIGLEVGKEYDIPCTFPADYSSADLAGKAVTFKVTVTAINVKTPATFTDEFVQSIASDYKTEAKTTAEFTDFARETLEKKAKTTFDNTKYTSIWQVIATNTNISGYPDDELQKLSDTVISNMKSEYTSYGSYYGVSDYATYLSSVYGYASEAAFADYAKSYAQNYLKEKMVLTMIAKAENITPTQDAINDMGAQLAAYYGYDSYQGIIDKYGSGVESEVGYSVLSEAVINFLNENAVEK